MAPKPAPYGPPQNPIYFTPTGRQRSHMPEAYRRCEPWPRRFDNSPLVITSTGNPNEYHMVANILITSAQLVAIMYALYDKEKGRDL